MRKLAANLFAKGLSRLEILFRNVLTIERDVKLRPDFSGGSLGDEEKMAEIGIRASLGTFSDVGEH